MPEVDFYALAGSWSVNSFVDNEQIGDGHAEIQPVSGGLSFAIHELRRYEKNSFKSLRRYLLKKQGGFWVWYFSDCRKNRYVGFSANGQNEIYQCAADQYQIQFMLHDKGFSLYTQVHGPSKNYLLCQRFSRI